MFGSSATQQSTPFSFGSNTSTPQAKPAFSFGSTQQQPQSAAQSPLFSFGGTNNNNNNSNTAQQQQKPAFSFGGFGSQQQTPQQQQPQQPQNSLFGFGGTQQNQTPQAQSQQNTQPFGSSTFNFGSQQQPQQSSFQQQQPFSGFNIQSQPQQSSLFSSLGQNNPQQQQQQYQQGQNALTKTTRVSDLPEASQSQIEELDKFIQSQIYISEDFAARKDQIDQFIRSVVTDVDEVQRRFSHTTSLLRSDEVLMEPLVESSAQALDTARNILRSLDIMQNPSLSTIGRPTITKDIILDYFQTLLGNVEKLIPSYTGVIGEFEGALRGLDQSAMEDSNVAIDLQQAIQGQFDVFLTLVSKVAVIHEQIERLQGL